MYQIAICDGEIAELDRVEGMLREGCSPLAKSAFVLKRFTDIGNLLRKVEIGNYQPDILLMDISTQGGSGIETVRKLRSMGGGGQVIFFASSPEYALAAFDVAASSYLLRPVSENALYRALDRTLQEIRQDRRRYVLFRTDSGIRRLALEDIVYCEAQGKRQCVYLTGGAYIQLRTTMARLREVLCAHREFTGIGVSYIINLWHVERWDKQVLLLDNGEILHMPRGAYRVLPAGQPW